MESDLAKEIHHMRLSESHQTFTVLNSHPHLRKDIKPILKTLLVQINGDKA